MSFATESIGSWKNECTPPPLLIHWITATFVLHNVKQSFIISVNLYLNMLLSNKQI